MKYSAEEKTKLKNTPITSYLQNIGIHPITMSGGRLTYHCPLKEERTPSFMVHPETNKFKCFGCEQKGDVIELVAQLEKLDFLATLDRLATLYQVSDLSFSFIGQNPLKENDHNITQKGLILIDEKPLQSPKWFNYVSSRGIPIEIARTYLHEVRYRNGTYIYDAVGFKTDNGGYAIRSPKGKGFKAFIGYSHLTSIHVADFDTVNLFEGFFDFLSALTYYQVSKPTNTTVVLNSTANLKQALPALEGSKRINCYFDNDSGGRSTFVKLKALNLPVNDYSYIYSAFKDFNDMIRNRAI